MEQGALTMVPFLFTLDTRKILPLGKFTTQKKDLREKRQNEIYYSYKKTLILSILLPFYASRAILV